MDTNKVIFSILKNKLEITESNWRNNFNLEPRDMIISDTKANNENILESFERALLSLMSTLYINGVSDRTSKDIVKDFNSVMREIKKKLKIKRRG